MPRADVVEIYELLRPKLGEEESKALLHFVEDRTIHLVQDEMAKGLATKEDISAVKEDVAAVKADITALERDILAFEWRTRLYLVAIGALIVVTNPRVLDLLVRLLGITP